MSGGVVVSREVWFVTSERRVLLARGPWAHLFTPGEDDRYFVQMRWAGWRHPLSVLVTVATTPRKTPDFQSVAVVRVGVRRALDLRRRMRGLPVARVVRR